MQGNGQLRNGSTEAQVLHWPGRVLSAEDLRRSLNGHRELLLSPRAIITPLAAEELRTNGVQVRRTEEQPAAKASWGYVQDRPHSQVSSAVQSLQREGIALKDLGTNGESDACRWARVVAECVASGACRGGVVFCQDPGLVCCAANKVMGLRAVAVVTIGQAARATLTLGPNLVVVEMPGRTFFEIRQILRTVCATGQPACPPGVACTLQELDGHAHR